MYKYIFHSLPFKQRSLYPLERILESAWDPLPICVSAILSFPLILILLSRCIFLFSSLQLYVFFFFRLCYRDPAFDQSSTSKILFSGHTYIHIVFAEKNQWKDGIFMKFRMGTFEQYFRERLHIYPLQRQVPTILLLFSNCFIIIPNILALIFLQKYQNLSFQCHYYKKKNLLLNLKLIINTKRNFV